MTIKPKDFKITPGKAVNLSHWPTTVDPYYKSNDDYKTVLEDHQSKLAKLQKLHWGSDRRALLLIFQGTDAAGKDGAIRHVMSGVNPAGCEVFEFKPPSAEELKHDFLWRTTCRLPERGRIGMFNRSYYEEVLVLRVHPEILHHEALVDAPAGQKKLWRHRYRSINDLERHLFENSTRIVKFFLHLSKAEQRKRFLDRINTPDENWKFSAADIRERAFWSRYVRAYEECLGATSTKHAPWYVIPADDKENARLIVSRIVIDTLEDLKMSYPKSDNKRRRELKAIAKKLS
jgi:PPK2 family polyphosphate:nucleotide phosphotransferase